MYVYIIYKDTKRSTSQLVFVPFFLLYIFFLWRSSSLIFLIIRQGTQHHPYILDRERLILFHCTIVNIVYPGVGCPWKINSNSAAGLDIYPNMSMVLRWIYNYAEYC